MAVTHLFESLVPDGNDETQVRSSDWNAAHVLSNALKAIDGLTPAASKIAYFSGADSAALTDITATGISLLGVADAAAGRTTLELGTVATQAANNVSLTGGSISGMTSISGSTLASTVATGTAPLTITSSTLVTNLNTDTVDGFHASQTAGTNQIPVLNAGGRLVLGVADDGSTKLQIGGSGLIKGDLTIGSSSSDSNTLYHADISGQLLVLPTYANKTTHLTLRPNGAGGLPAIALHESPTNASGTNALVIGTGINTVPAAAAWNIGASISGVTAANSYPINFNVSNVSKSRFAAVSITNSGRVLMSGSGAVLPTDNGIDTLQLNGTIASKGIKLDGTASADVNTLDYYQEGTFTPVLVGLTTAGEGTYNVQTGKYTRLGNVVHFTVKLDWTAHTGTGNMQITGMPFTTSDFQALPNYSTNLVVGSGKVLSTYIYGAAIELRAVAPAGGASEYITMDTSGILFISGSYLV